MCSTNAELLKQLYETNLHLEEYKWDAFIIYGMFCARWQGILLFPAAPYMINLDVKLLTPGLQLWLDATDPLANGTLLTNGTPVPTWYDKSGNLNNASNGVSPFYANNSLVFNGASFLDTTLTARPMYETIFVVFLMAAPLSGSFNMVGTNSQAGRALSINNNNLGYNVSGVNSYSNTNGGIVRGVTTLVAGTILAGPDNGVGTTYINGGTYISQSQVFTTYGEGITRIGAGNGSSFFNGTISEVLIYNRALSSSERQKIEGYLAWKWRINNSLPSTHNYYSSFEIVIQEVAALTNLPTFITSVNLTNVLSTEFTVNWSGGNNTTYYRYTIDGVETVPLEDQGVISRYARFGGFTIGTVHSVIITAYNTAGSRSSSTFLAGTMPSQPVSLSESGPSVSGFRINWSGVIGATSYTYTLNGITTLPTSSTATSASFSGLSAGTYYVVIVTAVNSYSSNSSTPFNAVTRPSQPTSLNLTNGSSNGFTINWLGGVGATSFTFTLNGITTIPVSSTSTSATFRGLLEGTTYAVIVIANNSLIPSDSNVSVTFNTTTTPGQPTSLTVTNGSLTGFRINWSGALGATSYIYIMNGSPIVPSIDQGVANKYIVFTGISQGINYVISIVAVNSSGSNSSDSITVTTPPTTPTSLTLSNINSSGFQVNWVGGTGAIGYSYQLNGMTVIPSNDQGIASNYAVFNGLSAGFTYNIVIIARNTGGFSMSNSIVSSLTGLQVWLDGANPLGTGVLPVNNSILPLWYDLSTNFYNATPVNSPVYNNSAISFNGTSQYYTTTYTSSPTTESIFVVYKQNSVAYMALVDTSSQGGRSFISKSVNGPSLANSQNTWYLNGLYPISTNTTYIAECLYNSSGVSIYINGNVSSTNTSNPSYNAGVTYIGAGNYNSGIGYYLDGTISEVLIFNSVLGTADRQKVEGYLAWKWGLQSTLPIAHPYYTTSPTGSVYMITAPSQPSSLTLTNGSDTGFTINWTGGNGATSYTYTMNGSPVTPSIDLGLSNKRASFNGLTLATSYEIVVIATNSTGSVSSSSFTAITTPSKPVSLTLTNVFSDRFTVSWSGGQGATSYIYTLNGSSVTASSDLGLLSKTATFSGLAPNTRYSLFITAANTSGTATSESQFNPTSVSGIQVWLDANDPLNTGVSGQNGSSIVTWYDKSGKSNNMTFSGSSVTYSNASVNSLNTVFANGLTQGTLSVPMNTFSANYCGFIVLRNTTTANTPNALFNRTDSENYPAPLDICGVGDGKYYCGVPSGRQSLGVPSEFLPKIIGNNLIEVLLTTYASTGGTGNFNAYVNGFPMTLTGGAVTGLNATDATTSSIYFGGITGTQVQMITNFCEIIMYNTNLSIGNRQLIEGYLAWKWGLQNKPLFNPSTYLSLITNTSDTGSNPQTVTNNNVVFGRSNSKNAAKFNNSTGTYLSLPFPYGTGSFTISYWFTTNDSGYYNPVSLSNTSIGSSYGINPDLTNGTQNAYVNFTGGILSLAGFSYPASSGRWFHFAITVDASSKFCQLYGNGVAKSSGTGSGTLRNSAYLIVGKAGDSQRAFNGAINNITVYNSALSSSQILDIYNSQLVTNSLEPTHPYFSTQPTMGLQVSTLPTTPSSFSLTDITATGFTINWAIGIGANNYTFTLNTVSTVPSLVSPNSASFTGLSAGTIYSVIVTAVNEFGLYANSAPYNAGTAPSKPSSLVISNVTGTSFRVAWSGGVGATSYTYNLNGSPTIPFDDQGLSSKYAIFTGLTGNTSYNIYITAINSIGSSSSASSVSPSSISGLQCWLDGNDPLNTGLPGANNSSLSTWYDKSGNSRNMVFTGSSTTYTNSSINSLNTIYVNGTALGTISIPTGTFSSNYSGFIILKTTTAPATIFSRTDTSGWGIFDYQGDIYTATAVGNRTLISNNKAPVNTAFLGFPIMMDFGLTNYAATGGTGVYNEYYSGVSVPLSGGSTSGLNSVDTISSNIYFGGSFGISMNHKVNYCEILLFNTNITSTNRQILEGYLAWKWGLQSVRPYVAQTVLLLTENTIDTGVSPQIISNSGVSVVSLVTNPSKKSSASFTTGNYLSLPFNYGSGSFSITYWTYCSSTASMTEWSLSSGVAAGINADVTNGTQHFYLTFTGGTVNAGNWTAPATSGQWYQSILTVNAETGDCKSYLNGVLKNTASGVGALQNTGYLFLGRNAANTQGFTGYLNNFAVYNYVLTQTQITKIYNSESIVNLLPSSHPYYTSPPLSGISTFTLPPKPTSLSLSNVSLTGFTVNWSGTSGITSFTYSLNGVNTVPASSTSTSASFTGLSSGTAYVIIVNSVNSGGSTASDSLTGSTLPSQPSTLSSSSISRNGFTISWTGGATATSYSYTLNGSSRTPSNDQGLISRTATFTELSGGTTYAVIVTAINSYGSTASNSFNVLTIPEEPTSLNSTNITTAGFTVNWSGANGATSYTYRIDSVTKLPASSTSTSATFTGLSAGTSYAIIVTTVNASGSTASSSFSILTLPSVPFNLTQTAGSFNSVTVGWFGGIGATSYTYTLNGTSTTPSDDQGVVSKYVVFSGLTSGTIYSIVITAINSSGSTSSPPTVSNVSGQYLWIDGNDPLGSGTLPANNSTLSTLYDKSGNSRNLSVTSPATPASFSTNSVNGLANLIFANSVYRSATFTGTVLFPFDVYLVLKLNSVTAAASICSICQSNSASSYNALSFSSSKWNNASETSVRTTNTIASSTETSTNYILIQWSFGNSNFNIYRNGSQIAYTSSYTYTPPASLSFLLGLSVDNTTTGNFNGAIAEIVAYNTLQGTTNRQYIEGALAWKWGIQSSLSSSHPYYLTRPVGPYIYTSPLAPTSLSLTNGSSSGFTINWSGASGATSFKYTLNGVNTVPASSTSTSASFTGLTGGTSYTVIVIAFNGPVANSQSDSFSVTTFPTQPNNASLLNVTSTGFTATWLGGAGATSYTFELNGVLVTPSSYTLSPANVVFTGLQPNTSYVLVINAINVGGTSVSESQFNPSVISGLSLWLDGADPNATGIAPSLNSAVTIWKDKTSNNNHYSLAGATYANDTQFNKNGILFNGSTSGAIQANSNLAAPFAASNKWSILVVHRGTGSTSVTQGLWRVYDLNYWLRWNNGVNLTISSNVSTGLSAVTYDNFKGVTCLVTQGTNAIYSFNGTASSTLTISNTTTTNTTRIVFGCAYENRSESLTGYIDEVLIFNTNISVSDRQKMEGYLAWKWNTQASLPEGHPHKTFGPVSSLRIQTGPSEITAMGFSEGTGSSFKVTWSGGNGATSYTYTINSVATVPSTDAGVSSKYAIFTGLAIGTSYTVIVTAISGGASTASSPFSANTAPVAPYALSSSSVTSTGFTVNWLGGDTATSYTYTLNGSSVTPSVDNGVASKTATFTGLSSNTTYNVSITAINAGGSTVAQNTPSAVQGLQLWLDGADPNATGVVPALGSALTTWKDKTSNNNHYTLTNATYSYDSVYARNAVLFSGSSSGGLQTNSSLSPFNDTYRWTIFTVHRGTNSGNNLQTIWRRFPSNLATWLRWYNGSISAIISNNNLSVPALTYDTSKGIWCFVSSGSSALFSLNGTASSSASISDTNMNSSSRITIASADVNTEVLAGYMCEVLVYNTNLSVSDRQKIEGYLAWKWNTKSFLATGHPYYSSESPLLSVSTLPVAIAQDPLGPLVYLNASSYNGSGTWFDTSPNGKNATLETGSISRNARGNGIVLNGSTSWTFPNVSVGNAWSFSVWYKNTRGSTGFANSAAIFNQIYNSTPININLSDWTGNGMQVSFFNSGWFTAPSISSYFTNNTWINTIGTWDGTTINVYINGSLVQSTAPVGTSRDGGGAYRIGRRYDNATYATGDIGELRIYNFALTGTQATSVYNSTSSLYTS
jgi:hypothetical protein